MSWLDTRAPEVLCRVAQCTHLVLQDYLMKLSKVRDGEEHGHDVSAQVDGALAVLANDSRQRLKQGIVLKQSLWKGGGTKRRSR